MLTIIGDITAVNGEVKTSLQDCGVTSVTVNTDPGRGRVGATAAGGCGGSGDRESTRHSGVGTLKWKMRRLEGVYSRYDDEKPFHTESDTKTAPAQFSLYST